MCSFLLPAILYKFACTSNPLEIAEKIANNYVIKEKVVVNYVIVQVCHRLFISLTTHRDCYTTNPIKNHMSKSFAKRKSLNNLRYEKNVDAGIPPWAVYLRIKSLPYFCGHCAMLGSIYVQINNTEKKYQF